MDDSVPIGKHIHRPVWSPDGAKIAYLVLGERRKVFVYDREKKKLLELSTDISADIHPTWISREELVISDYEGAIFAINVVSQKRREIGDKQHGGLVVGFSEKTGEVFMLKADVFPTFGLYKARLSNEQLGAIERVVPDQISSENVFSVTRDGKYVVYTDLTASGTSGVVIVDVKRRARTRVVVEKGWSDEYACVNPEGTAILAVSRLTGSKQAYRGHARYAKLKKGD